MSTMAMDVRIPAVSEQELVKRHENIQQLFVKGGIFWSAQPVGLDASLLPPKCHRRLTSIPLPDKMVRMFFSFNKEGPEFKPLARELFAQIPDDMAKRADGFMFTGTPTLENGWHMIGVTFYTI